MHYAGCTGASLAWTACPRGSGYDGAGFLLSSLRRVAVTRPGRPQEAFALRLPPRRWSKAREWILDRLGLERRRPGTTDAALWDRTRAAAEDLLSEIGDADAVNVGVPHADAAVNRLMTSSYFDLK